jgi:hypothetical protein
MVDFWPIDHRNYVPMTEVLQRKVEIIPKYWHFKLSFYNNLHHDLLPGLYSAISNLDLLQFGHFAEVSPKSRIAERLNHHMSFTWPEFR